MSNNNEESKNQERREIDALLNKGFSVSIKYTVKKVFRKPEERTMLLEFREPTLAVLDLVTERYLNMSIEEVKKDAPSADHIRQANKNVHANADKMAEILAIFALGENCFTYDCRRYLIEFKKIKDLAGIIKHAIKPGELEKLISIMTALANLPAFLVSTTLVGAARTTRADMVE